MLDVSKKNIKIIGKYNNVFTACRCANLIKVHLQKRKVIFVTPLSSAMQDNEVEDFLTFHVVLLSTIHRFVRHVPHL